MQQEVVTRLALRYSISLPVASLFTLLITEDCVSPRTIHDNFASGMVLRDLVYRLRRRVPTLLISQQRSVGYWLQDYQRHAFALEFHATLPAHFLERMQRLVVIGRGALLVEHYDARDADIVQRTFGDGICKPENSTLQDQ